MSLAHNHHHHAHGDLTNRAAIASVTMALFLLALKIFAAAETGSVALLASLADTGFDVLASVLTLFSTVSAMARRRHCLRCFKSY